jgi:hypothetical protein
VKRRRRVATGTEVGQRSASALQSSLLERFPILRKWLGLAAFASACEAHQQRQAGAFTDAAQYARAFLETLGQVFNDRPEVRELAWLDLARAEISLTEEQQSLRAQGLTAADLDDCRVLFVASLKFTEGATNAADI